MVIEKTWFPPQRSSIGADDDTTRRTTTSLIRPSTMVVRVEGER